MIYFFYFTAEFVDVSKLLEIEILETEKNTDHNEGN